MDNLPILIDADDAIDAYFNNKPASKALQAKIIALLSEEGFTNGQIRQALQIEKDYVVSHLKRAGETLTDTQLTLWHNNPQRITLGHIRALCSLNPDQREQYLRQLLQTRVSVNHLERISQGHDNSAIDQDLKRYEQKMSEVTGRMVELSYDPSHRSGKITLSWHGFDDLDDVAARFGFKASEHI